MTALPAFLIDTSEALAGWLLASILLGTLAALLTAIGLRVFRRVPPALQAALWLIVIIKFVVPYGPASSVSLAGLIGIPAAPGPAMGSPAEKPGSADTNRTSMIAWVDVAEGASSGAPVVVRRASPDAVHLSPWVVASLLYLAGLALFAWLRIRAHLNLVRRTRRLAPADAATCDAVLRVCRRVARPAPMQIRVSDDAPAPYVLGILRPTLVLSRRQLADPDELEAVVLHEIAHCRRGDLWVRYLQWLAGTLLYFWPVVAWVNRRMDLARESACDEWALRHARLSPTRYARCLLRAVQPRRSGWSLACPAAMAVDAAHVERRIEMILQRSDARLAPRGWRRLALAVPLLWGAFVLTSAPATAARAHAVHGQDAGQPPAKVVVVKTSAAGQADGEDVLIQGPIAIECDEGAFALPLLDDGDLPADAMVFLSSDDEAGLHNVNVMLMRGQDDSKLAEFLASHPSADADRDGVLTPTERSAYLVALVMTAPDSVLKQFTRADQNKDGALDETEAAGLVLMPALAHGPRFVRHLAPGQPGLPGDADLKAVLAKLPPELAAKVEAAKADGDQVCVMRMRSDGSQTEEVVIRAPDDGGTIDLPEGRFRVQKLEGEPGKMFEVHLAGPAGAGFGAWVPSVADWLEQNVSAVPTAATVARYIPVVEAAPLTLFLRAHPKADADHDGVLTADERKAYLDARMSSARAKLLERMPQADANADGVLTHEELKAHLETLQGAGQAGPRRMILRTDGEDGTEHKEIVVEVLGADEPK